MNAKLRLAVFGAFVAVQGLFPLRAVLTDARTRTDFTWDMFAVRRECSDCEIRYSPDSAAPQAMSWGLRSPRLVAQLSAFGDGDSAWSRWLGWSVEAPTLTDASVEELARFDALGEGALLLHPSRPAVNVRAAPQVARLKTRDRLPALGAQLCRDFEAAYTDALNAEPVPRWVYAEAMRWDQGGRRMRVEATCVCSYNAGDPIPLVEPTRNLCEGAAP